MLFDSWYGLLRVIAVGPLAYFALVLLLRVSGKRTLAKLNAFDLIVTVALGSTLATVLLSKSVPLVEGIAGLIVLVCLQFVVAWLSVRSDRVSDLVKSEPTLLLHNGAFLPRAAWCMEQRYAWGTPNPPFRIRRREHSSGVPLPAFG
jgi:uncharacterized membrane protein YcaP (DUF421 family)